jgi:hypothetical protein
MNKDKIIIANFSKVIDLEKPSNITGLIVTDAKDGKLDISWNAASDNSGIDHYEIHRNGILITNVTGLSYRDTGLTNGNPYSYQIRAVDTSGNKGNLSNAVSGTPTESSNNNNNNNNQESYNPVVINNQIPTANAGGPYNGYTNEIIIFDASKSSDPDADKIEYRWDFDGDGKYDTEWLKNAITSHIYPSSGDYIVKLEVKDIKGATSTNVTLATIEFKANNLPTNITLDGPKNGNKNVDYIYTANAIDIDAPSDMLRFIFNWSDGANDTSMVVPSGTPVNITHNWSSYGAYKVTVYAEDNNLGISEKISFMVLIDVIVINDEINGELIDENSDGVYDSFYNYENKKNCSVETKDNTTYLINSDEDEEWDYQYNIKNNKLNKYEDKKELSDLPEEQGTLNLSLFGIMSLLIGLILLFIFVFI